MKPGYQTDLAYIHDTAFTGFVRQAAPWLLEQLRANGTREGRVVDLGCGSGRWAAELLRKGYDVEGVDLSPSMIRLAKTRAPRGKFHVASLLAWRIPRCVAVTAIGECVNYGFDEKNSSASLKKLFRRVHGALEPGGLFIFDAAEPGLAANGPVRTWFEGRDFAILLDLTEQPQKSVAMRRMTVFRHVHGTWRRTEEAHPLRLFPRECLKPWLEEAGFAVKVVAGYGEQKFRPSLAGFVCRKVG